MGEALGVQWNDAKLQLITKEKKRHNIISVIAILLILSYFLVLHKFLRLRGFSASMHCEFEIRFPLSFFLLVDQKLLSENVVVTMST